MAKYVLSDIFQGDFHISQVYGANIEYYKQITRNAQSGLSTLNRGHEGVDWATPIGTPIVAPYNGFILRAEVNDVYGNVIVVWDDKQKCAVWFCHLLDVSVKKGQAVVEGQILGHTGNSGRFTTGPHCHVNFVETDENANRLNQDNGSLGFLNILDPNLVEWKLKLSQQVEAPTTQTVTINATIPSGDSKEDYMLIKKSDFTGMRGKCDIYDPMAAAGYHNLEEIDNKVKQLAQEKQTAIESKETEVKTRDDEIQSYKGQIKDLNDQLRSVMANYEKKCEEDSAVTDSSLREGKLVQSQAEDIKAIAQTLNVGANKKDIIDSIVNLADKAKKWDTQKSIQKKIITNTITSTKSLWEKLFGFKI